jgi:hypothetical protein
MQGRWKGGVKGFPVVGDVPLRWRVWEVDWRGGGYGGCVWMPDDIMIERMW